MEGSIDKRSMSTRSLAESMAEIQSTHWEREVRATLAWSNTFLSQRQLHAKELEDFGDGVLLINLLEQAFGKKVGAYRKEPRLPFHKLDNVQLAFDFLQSQKIQLLSVDANDIIQGRQKPILNVLWNILRCLTIRQLRALTGRRPSFQSASTGGAGGGDDESEDEEEKAESADSVRDTLLKWTAKTFAAVPSVSGVKDFWDSFKDGIAFAAIVEKLAPGHIDVATLRRENAKENLQLAFRVAEEQLGIPSLLQPEDFAEGKKPAERVVENYVSMLVTAAQGRAKQQAEVEALQQAVGSMQAQKAEEVDSLRREVEAERKQFETLQSEMERMRQEQQKMFASEGQLKDKLALVEKERELFTQQVEALKKELDKAREQLLASLAQNEQLAQAQVQLGRSLDESKATIQTREEEAMILRQDLARVTREHESVVSSFRAEMKESQAKVTTTEDAKTSAMSELLLASIRDKKGYNDFLNAMPVKRGWFLKRRPGKDGKKLLGNAFRKRYVELKGDTINWYKDVGGPVQGSASLKYYKKVAFELPEEYDPERAAVEGVVKRGSILNLKSDDEQLIHLEPVSGDAPAKVMELAPLKSNVNELNVDLFEWIEEINRRIAIINYLRDMFENNTHTRACREIVEFITDVSKPVLRVENRVTDLHDALRHFKETLIMRKGLSIKAINVALGDPVAEIVAEVVARNNTVAEIDLSRNFLTAKGVGPFSAALRRNRSLCMLRLDHNDIGDEGLTVLSEGLVEHPRLSVLSVASNRITDRGVLALTTALKKSQEVRKRPHEFSAFELGGNQISDAGAKAVAELIAKNNTVGTVNLEGNWITDAGAEALAHALVAPECRVRELNLARNQITSKGAKALATAVQAIKDRNVVLDLSANALLTQAGVQALLATNLNFDFPLLRMRSLVVPLPPSQPQAPPAAPGAAGAARK